MSAMDRRTVRSVYDSVRGYLVRRVGLAAALWVVVPVAVALVFAWVLSGGSGWRQGSWTPLVLDIMVLVGAGAMVWYWIRGRGRWLAEARVASTIEDSAGLARGVVLGSLELARSIPHGVSQALAHQAEGSVARRLTGSRAGLAGALREESGRWIRRGMGTLAVMGIAVVAAAVLTPERSRVAWAGLATPFKVMAQPYLPPLVVEPGNVEILRGESLLIEVEAPGRTEITLHSRAAGDVPRSATRDAIDTRTSFAFPAVMVELEYWATAPDGASSERYTVTPVDPLFLADLTVELTFPPHSGRFAEEYRGATPPLTIPVGTRIHVDGRVSRPLGGAMLVLADEEASGQPLEVPLEVAGASFVGDWRPRRSGVYHWRLQDEAGSDPDSPPLPLDITLVRDSVPSVAIVFPGRDTVIPLSLQQPLVLQARDDHGLASVELLSYRVDSFGERGDAVVQRLAMAGTRSALIRPLLDVSGWGLLAGDTIRYRARTVDNSPSPQVGESLEFVLRMPGASELRWQAQQMLEDAAADVESLAEQAGQAAEETRNLEQANEAERTEDEGRPSQQNQGQMTFEEQEELRRALEGQENLMAEVDSLKRELEELSESLRDAGLPDPELRDDLEELQRLLQESMTDEARERMAEMAEALSEMDERASQEALEQLAEDQEEMRRRLEESIERFRRAAVEQEFRAAESEAEELARKEQALAEALEEGDNPELRAQQQAELEQQAEGLQERMEDIREGLDQLGEQKASEQTEGAQDRTSEARQNMAEAREQAEAGETQDAAQEAQEAANALREAADQLQEARDEMAQQMQDAARQALEQTATDALSLARQQSELREEMRQADSEEQAGLRGDEAALLQGVRNMAENLSVAARGSDEVNRDVGTAMGEAMQAMSETLEALDSRRGSTPSPSATSEGAVQALNRVAVRALANAGEVGQEGASSAAEQMQQQLESIAKQQGEVMMQADEIMPMQLSQQAMANQMQQMAQGQEAVAGDLGELAEEPGAESQALGDLEALAEEAAALAEQLALGRLEPEILERQEQLFQRLLDAGRSLERDEESEERESEAAGEFERGTVLPLTAESLGALRYTLPDAAALTRLPPAQRRMVIDYFERLNRPSLPPPPGGNR